MKNMLIFIGLMLCCVLPAGSEEKPPAVAVKFAELVRAKWQYLNTKPVNRKAVAQFRAGDFELKHLASTIDLVSPTVGDFGLMANSASLRVVQIIDDETMIAMPQVGKRTGEPLILRDFPTRGLADGKLIGTEDLLEISGTEKYENVLGARVTRYVVRPVDLSQWKAKILEMAGVVEPPKKP